MSIEDIITVGEMLSPSSCIKNVIIIMICITYLPQCSASMLLLDNKSQDYLGYCIAHSSCKWILAVSATEKQNLKALATGATSRRETNATVVGLKGLRYGKTTDEEHNSNFNEEKEEKQIYLQPLTISAEVLNSFFTDMKLVMKLEELSLRLPVDCSRITWPNLSGLRKLHLQISGKQNWRLDTILLNYYSLLEVFRISSATCDTVLLPEDCMAIANLLSYSHCLKSLCIEFTDNSSPLVIESISPIIEAMATNQSMPLSRFDLLCYCKFSATKRFAEFIKNSTTLKHLTIGWCVFDIQDFLDLSIVVHQLPQLQETEISFNGISVKVEGGKETQLFTQLLADSPDTLRLNTVTFTRIHDGEVEAIASALIQWYDIIHKMFTSDVNVLHKLNLSDNNITDNGVCSLVKALNHKASPRALNLSRNCISNDGITVLAHALTGYTAVEHLNLSYNSIDDEGAAIIVESLHNQTLSDLNLSSNNITDVGAASIAKGLSPTSHLRRLNLSNNYITDDGAMALAQAFCHTAELKVLNLSANNGIGEEGTNHLVQALAKKNAFKFHHV